MNRQIDNNDNGSHGEGEVDGDDGHEGDYCNLQYVFGEVCHCNSKRNTVLPSDLVVFNVSFAFGFHEKCNNKQVKNHNNDSAL